MPMLDFKGKQFVYAHHLSVPFRTLEIDAKKSLPLPGSKPDLDDNLIIHGDNLHALKALLPTYAGKVDCIFIDPPYNTGEEGWCYNDNVRSPLMKEWLKKSANPVDKEDLERHDKWLCMMWPRLKLLWELLSENGSLWITLDDNEVHRARSILEEVFGQDCCVGQLAWQKRTSRENRAPLSPSIDHLLLYSKGLPDTWKLRRNLIPVESSEDDDENGGQATGTIPFSAQGFRKNQVYKITTPTGVVHDPPKGRCWGATEPEFEKLKEQGRIYWPKEGDGRPRVIPEEGEHRGLVPNTLWLSSEVGNTEGSKKRLMEIFSERDELGIHAPKPHELVQRVVQISTRKDSIVLDSFAGSGTTAHAILKQNQKDGGNRRFILVECEDYADTLTAERVRRVVKGYSFEGTQREELYRRKLNFTALKKADEFLGSIEGIENLEGHRFDKIGKTVKNDELIVTGEKKVTEKTEGLGGSFTYCTLGEEINLQTLLSGEKLPAYDALAKYVFYTATGQTLTTVGGTGSTPSAPPSGRRGSRPSKPGGDAAGGPENCWFIGETTLYRVHLLYKPDKKWLRSNASALTQELVDAIAKQADPSKKTLVFASTKFMGQKDLTRQHIEFCQLPYAIYRVLGD